jgi:hypothetical protein
MFLSRKVDGMVYFIMSLSLCVGVRGMAEWGYAEENDVVN